MSAIAEPLKIHRWNYEEWNQLAASGLIFENRVELIDGMVFDVPPPHEPRCVAILLATRELRKSFPPTRFCIRVRSPLRVGNDSEPEPDLAVVPGSIRQASLTEHPKTAVIVIEVSDDALKKDRGIKAELYAAAGIADYWIVNLPQRQCEVRRKPARDAKGRFGFRYAQIDVYKSGESIAPLAATRCPVAVADLLP